jgi:membrane protease YdiL (CAAX protease family)
VWFILLEPLLALAGAVLLTLLLVQPFAPARLAEARFPLRRTSAVPESPETVAERVRALGLAGAVAVTGAPGRERLVLSDVEVESEEDLETSVHRVLVETGHEPTDPSLDWRTDLERLARGGLRIVLSLQSIVFLGAGLVLARFRVRPPAARPAAGRLTAAAVGVGGGLVALVASYVVSVGLEAIGLPVREQEWLHDLFADPSILRRTLPWILLAGPIAEEAFFRGYVFRFVRQEMGLAAGLVTSSALFALIHFNLSGFLVYLAMGAVLGYVDARTGRLLAPILGHATVNTVVVLATALGGPPAR